MSRCADALLFDRRVLVVEDSESLQQLYLTYLDGAPWRSFGAVSAAEALARIDELQPSLVLLDLHLPDASELELLEELARRHPDIGIVVLTANGSVDVAVRALRAGALDFLEKPVKRERLLRTLRNPLERVVLRLKVETLMRERGRDRFHGFIGASPVMQNVYRTIEAAAASRATVFITGESGTGKDVCAQAIHAQSPRAERAFVAVNCAAIPRDLLESELFGHVRGTFTGAIEPREGAAEQADGGTLFLDEIGELPLDLQSKLLRFLQTGMVQRVGASRSRQVDARIVCATNRDPWQEVRAGRFREDLYYRLNVVAIDLPPLRERGDDVLQLLSVMLERFSAEEGKAFTGFRADALAALAAYGWPGNVRELANAIHNIVVLNQGREVTAEMLPRAVLDRREAARANHRAVAAAAVVAPDRPAAASGGTPTTIVIEPLRRMERRLIEAALGATAGNVVRAAALLELSPSTLYRKLQDWQGGASGKPGRAAPADDGVSTAP